jgi:gliding motility-associated protein GldM
LKAEIDKNVFAEDKDKVEAIYKMLTVPATLKDFEEEVDWQLGMFDHAPVVAASALFTSLSCDIRNAEVKAIEILIARVKVPTFNFNKIDPLAFARTSYINMGDSLDLSVKVAAYDSTEVNQIRYGMDADTVEANWKDVSGIIKLDGSQAGVHKLKGVIGIKEKGTIKWKPWKFAYEVGKPTAVIANADLNVLYVGLQNKVEATASGYSPDKITLSAGGMSPQRSGEFYILTPPVSMKNKMVTLSVSGKNDDGSSKSLGSKEFKVRGLPTPKCYIGTTDNTMSSILKTDIGRGTLTAAYDATVPLNAKFTVNGFTMVVSKDGVEKKMTSNSYQMSAEMKNLIAQLKPGVTVSFKDVRISGPAGAMAGPAMSFTLK